MRETRFLVRLANSSKAAPQDHVALLTRLRRLSAAREGSVMNLRVSSLAVEFDLFGPAAMDSNEFARAWSEIGPLLTWRRIDLAPPPSVNAAAVIKEARAYFNDARYWEVHETLEGLWKARHGDEKRLVQGLILIAAAFVHVQRDELAVVWPMIDEGLLRLANSPDDYHGWDIASFRERVRRIREKQRFEEFVV